jgi:Zn-dependent peptidase ImmA (M78 family)/DNA-binding XRE family transcriptional regulator
MLTATQGIEIAQGIGTHLRFARERAGLSQAEAATFAGVPREVISYWENDRRVPGLAQLTRLADAYGVATSVLLGSDHEPSSSEDHAPIFRGLTGITSHGRVAVRRWLRFLNEWADLLEDAGETLPGRSLPPVRGWREPQAITDSRRAPRLAEEVRSNYDLGEDAIPDLLAFLEQQRILVYRVALDPIRDGEGVSGIFYNHPRLGYTILVNTHTTPGRQTFTLAHELAHALFHYQERGLVSRTRDTDRKERFADAFAAHFLVPGERLHELVETGPDGSVSLYDVVRLNRYFRVSYATMLNRLRNEGLLSDKQYRDFKGVSPASLARQLGLDCNEYTVTPARQGVSLATYPPSVLERVRQLIHGEVLTPSGAAELLQIPVEEILSNLLPLPEASTDEIREFAELPEPNAPRSRRKPAAA